jgi:hypothetical protein
MSGSGADKELDGATNAVITRRYAWVWCSVLFVLPHRVSGRSNRCSLSPSEISSPSWLVRAAVSCDADDPATGLSDAAAVVAAEG